MKQVVRLILISGLSLLVTYSVLAEENKPVEPSNITPWVVPEGAMDMGYFLPPQAPMQGYPMPYMADPSVQMMPGVPMQMPFFSRFSFPLFYDGASREG